jgi:hypothetical protein
MTVQNLRIPEWQYATINEDILVPQENNGNGEERNRAKLACARVPICHNHRYADSREKRLIMAKKGLSKVVLHRIGEICHN